MKTLEISHTTEDGKELELEITVEPADHSVGIMSPGIYDLKAFDFMGAPVHLSDAEYDALVENEKLLERVADAYYGTAEADY